MISLSLPDGPLTILCLGAHADDIEIGSAGTVFRLLSDHPGSSVNWNVFSASEDRAGEAKLGADVALAAATRATVQILDFEDSYLPSQHAELKRVFERLKTEVDPDLVLTHAGADAHQDHRTISELTWNTFRDHLILEYEIPKYDGDLSRPSVFVPLDETAVAAKIGLLADVYESQRNRDWFDEEVFRGLLRIRGMECRAASGYAEAFHSRKVVL